MDIQREYAKAVLRNAEPKTNADRIRAMTDEDLAMILQPGCPRRDCRDAPPQDCYQCWLDWLKEEAKEETE